MKKLLLFSCMILFCASFVVPVQGQNVKIKGVWELDNVKIQRIENSGDTTEIPYVEGQYANSTDCIFPYLEFESKYCYFDETDNGVEYSIENEKSILLWFTSPVELDFQIESNDRLFVLRQYEKYDELSKKNIKVKTTLTYSKN